MDGTAAAEAGSSHWGKGMQGFRRAGKVGHWLAGLALHLSCTLVLVKKRIVTSFYKFFIALSCKSYLSVD